MRLSTMIILISRFKCEYNMILRRFYKGNINVCVYTYGMFLMKSKNLFYFCCSCIISSQSGLFVETWRSIQQKKDKLWMHKFLLNSSNPFKGAKLNVILLFSFLSFLNTPLKYCARTFMDQIFVVLLFFMFI